MSELIIEINIFIQSEFIHNHTVLVHECRTSLPTAIYSKI